MDHSRVIRTSYAAASMERRKILVMSFTLLLYWSFERKVYYCICRRRKRLRSYRRLIALHSVELSGLNIDFLVFSQCLKIKLINQTALPHSLFPSAAFYLVMILCPVQDLPLYGIFNDHSIQNSFKLCPIYGTRYPK